MSIDDYPTDMCSTCGNADWIWHNAVDEPYANGVAICGHCATYRRPCGEGGLHHWRLGTWEAGEPLCECEHGITGAGRVTISYRDWPSPHTLTITSEGGPYPSPFFSGGTTEDR